MTVPHFIPVSVWEKASNNWTSTWQARHFQLFYRRLPMRKDRGRNPCSAGQRAAMSASSWLGHVVEAPVSFGRLFLLMRLPWQVCRSMRLCCKVISATCKQD
jgi:hypothetical protein